MCLLFSIANDRILTRTCAISAADVVWRADAFAFPHQYYSISILVRRYSGDFLQSRAARENIRPAVICDSADFIESSIRYAVFPYIDARDAAFVAESG